MGKHTRTPRMAVYLNTISIEGREYQKIVLIKIEGKVYGNKVDVPLSDKVYYCVILFYYHWVTYIFKRIRKIGRIRHNQKRDDNITNWQEDDNKLEIYEYWGM